MRLACALTALGPVGVLWATTTNGHPQWHDQLVIALLPTAGALGLTAILRGRRGARQSVPRSTMSTVPRWQISRHATASPISRRWRL